MGNVRQVRSDEPRGARRLLQVSVRGRAFVEREVSRTEVHLQSAGEEEVAEPLQFKRGGRSDSRCQ